MSFFLKRIQKIFFVRRGLTLVEITLVTAILGVVSVLVYQSIVNGLKVWSRSQIVGAEQDAAILLDRMTGELHNAFRFSLMKCSGSSHELVFATIVHTPLDKKKANGQEGYEQQLGMVRYEYDLTAKTLVRQQANYSQALKEKFGMKKVLLRPLKSFRFVYYVWADNKLEKQEKFEDKLPVAVEVFLEFDEQTGGTRKMKRMILIPIS